MYQVSDFINSVVERIVLTIEAFWAAVSSVHYSFGEFYYDIKSLWS